MSKAIRFGVQTDPTDAKEFRQTAKTAEAAGLYALFVPDHPGSCTSPFVALAAAASVTGRIRLGTYVLNTGVHHPLQTANDLNTLDLLSEGRAILGVGAGHTPAEWTQCGLSYPNAKARVDRMITFTKHVRALSRGEAVNGTDEYFAFTDASITSPVAHQSPIPLLVGGNGPNVLRFAGAHSETVSVSGLGATKSDGHSHIPMWTHAEIDRSINHIRTGAAGSARSTGPVIEALVQCLKITNDRQGALDSFARLADIDVSLAEDIPFVLIGTVSQIADQIAAHRERWNFTSFVARASDLADLTALLLT
jgi:probable F420-dependent oxidoreductase